MNREPPTDADPYVVGLLALATLVIMLLGTAAWTFLWR